MSVGDPGIGGTSTVQQVIGDPFGVCQGEEMAAGYDVRVHAEAFAGDPSLEIQREEPVCLACQHAGWDPGPLREVAHRFEDRLCFGALMRFPFSRDVCSNVMQK